jgi:FtsH-binding integral membrane protein
MANAFEQTAPIPVAEAFPQERALFIRRTYTHLAGAIFAFVVLEYILLHSPVAPALVGFVFGSRYSWLLILGGFMVAGWLARALIAGAKTRPMQYVGLGIYIVAEAVIFLPILTLAIYFSSPKVLPNAALITAMLFAGLTVYAMTTRKDFSFLGGILTIGGFVALGFIVAGVLFGFDLGLFFSGAMVLLATGAILYDTSRIVRDYNTDAYVGASLQLFASVMLLFWYVLQIVMRLSDD